MVLTRAQQKAKSVSEEARTAAASSEGQVVAYQSSKAEAWANLSSSSISKALEPAISRALQVNRELQGRLRKTLAVCELAEEVAEKQQRLLVQRAEKKTESKRLPRRGASFFTESGNPRATPPANSHAAARAIFREKKLQSLNDRPWTVQEGDMLLQALETQLREEVFREVYVDEIQKASSYAEKRGMYQKLSDQLQTWTLMKMWHFRKCKTDWVRISQMLEKMGVQRHPRSCYVHFILVRDPRINHEAWTKEEDKGLFAAVAKCQGYDWEGVAQQVGTGRTAYQCFARYQQKLNPEILRREWDVKEDEKVQDISERAGGTTCACFSHIAAQYGPGRTRRQIEERMLVQLQPGIQCGE